MSRDPFHGKNDNFVEQVRGDAKNYSISRAANNYGVDWSPGASTFSQYVVIEVISDPHLFKGGTIEEDNATKLAYKEGKKTALENDAWENLPRNSIIAQPVNTSNSKVDDGREVFFPFFPSHLAIPCKPGEHVWVMHPSTKAKNSGYWFCKVTTLDFVDDVNHTHYPRMAQLPPPTSSEDLVKSKGKLSPEFRVGATFQDENGDVQTSSDGSHVVTNDETFYEKLLEESDASKIMTYEPVPRFKKRPGDLALEGSNNTLIVLGTDRTGSYANQVKDPAGKNKKTLEKTKDLDFSAGSIDLVAGRGQTPRTGGKKISSKRISDKTDFKSELDKLDTSIEEGDPDFLNDKSRILISQRTLIDKNTNIDSVNSEFNISDSPEGDASILLKSDKIRVSGRKDAQIIVKDDNGSDVTTIIAKSTGEIYLQSIGGTITIDPNGTITLSSKGDVVIKPSDTGYIKLGSETASLAVLCNDAIQTAGIVTALPVYNGAGGANGGAPGSGKYATKVLLA
jgi:hypothetical protein